MENKTCYGQIKTDKGIAKGSGCKKCGIYIEWIKTENNKDMPVDPNLITIITLEGKTIKGYIPHWATCEFADYFRKNGNGK